MLQPKPSTGLTPTARPQASNQGTIHQARVKTPKSLSTATTWQNLGSSAKSRDFFEWGEGKSERFLWHNMGVPEVHVDLVGIMYIYIYRGRNGEKNVEQDFNVWTISYWYVMRNDEKCMEIIIMY